MGSLLSSIFEAECAPPPRYHLPQSVPNVHTQNNFSNINRSVPSNQSRIDTPQAYNINRSVPSNNSRIGTPQAIPLTRWVSNSMSQPIPQLGQCYQLNDLLPYDETFIEIYNLFNESCRNCNYEITQIQQINNPFLLGSYELKKEEFKIRYQEIGEMYVFHGTQKKKIPTICKENFDWRLHGKSRGQRFGKGVSFSQISKYSSYYRDESDIINVMFVAKMLYGYLIPVEESVVLPPKIHVGLYGDTTVKNFKPNGNKLEVLVKFNDSEFYPEFLIYYKGKPQRAQATNKPHRAAPRQILY